MKTDLIIVDSHCDTLEKILDDQSDLMNKRYAFNGEDAKEYVPYIQYMAAFVDEKYVLEKKGYKRVTQLIDQYDEQNKRYKEDIKTITSYEDLNDAISNKKLGTVLSVENAGAIDCLDQLDELYQRGVRCLSLVWNNDNHLSCGNATKNDTGLTDFGKEVIKRMNDLGMLLDVSHISEKGFFMAKEIAKYPLIATHSCVKALCDHTRNLTDEQIMSIAETEGVIGVCFAKMFLTKNDKATAEDIARHIDYIIMLVGIDHVALGSDFDGLNEDNYPEDIKGVKDIKKIFSILEDMGYSEEDIEKIAGLNQLRVLKTVLKQ